MLDINPTAQKEQAEPANNTAEQPGLEQKGTTPPNFLNSKNKESNGKTSKNIFMEGGEENNKLVGTFTIIAFIIILAVAGALYFLRSQKTSQLATKETKIEELQAKLAKPELAQIDEQATRYSAGLKELSGFINNSPKYSILLKSLSELTPNEISLTNFSTDAKNAVKISGSSPDIPTISKFIEALQNSKVFSGVTVDKNQQTEDTAAGKIYYNFNISAKLDPKALVLSQEPPKTDSTSNIK